MNKLLETLYHSLYTPLEQSELQSEISSCHHQLTERLGKPERKLLLKLVDDYDHFVDVQSMDRGLSQILCKHRNAVQIEQNLFKAEVAQAAAALFSK